MSFYKYGMKYRGFSIGCQPMKGLDHREDDTTGKYHDILIYDRKLTNEEVRDYELVYIEDPENRLDRLADELLDIADPFELANDDITHDEIRAELINNPLDIIETLINRIIDLEA